MAEKLEFKNDIDVISVLRTRLLGYTTAPDGTTLLQAGNLTVKEVGEAILQDSGLREEIAGIIGVHADDVERIQEAIETLQGIDTDYGQRVTALETNKANKSDVYTKSETNEALALKADKATTYTKTEVDTLVEEAKPSDYEAVKGRVSELEATVATQNKIITDQGYKIDDLNASNEGIVNNWYNRHTEDGKLDIPSNVEVAEYAVVEKVKGENVEWNQLVGDYAKYGFLSDVGDGYIKIDGYAGSTFYVVLLTEGNNRVVSKVGHKYLFRLQGNTSDTVRLYNDNGGLWTPFGGGDFVLASATAEKNFYIRINPGTYDNLVVRPQVIDITDIGLGDVTSVDDSRLEWVKSYAETHPQYDAGSIKDAEDIVVESYDDAGEKMNELTIPISLKKGDVFDPNTGELTESYKRIEFPTDGWNKSTHSTSIVYTLELSDIKPSTTNVITTVSSRVVEWSKLGEIGITSDFDMSVSSTSKFGLAFLKDSVYADTSRFYEAIRGKELIYELATQVPPHKVTEPINSQVRIFNGGTLSIKSGVAQAEAEIQFHTNVKIKDELDKLKAENKSQGDRITNLEYENRITKAVLAKKIAEETEAIGTVIPFPSTGEEGYPLAEWGLLKRLKGKTWAWNLLGYREYTVTSSTRYYEILSANVTAGHIIFLDTYVSRPLATTGDTDYQIYVEGATTIYNAEGRSIAFIARTSANYVSVKAMAYGSFAGDLNARILLSDLTVLFGVTETKQVTEEMKTIVRNWATAHPEYVPVGSLYDSVYESVVSAPLVSSLINEYQWNWLKDNQSMWKKPNAMVFVKEETGEMSCIDDTIIVDGTSYRRYFIGKDSMRSASISTGATDTYRSHGYSGFVYLYHKADGYNIDITHADATSFDSVSSTISLSFLNSVEDIGIEGTVVDFEKETVTWNWKRLPSTKQWEYNSANAVWFTKVDDRKTGYTDYESIICDRYQLHKGSLASIPNMGVMGIYIGSPLDIAIKDSSISSSADIDAQILYELATPITKTFEELGITIPPSWDGGKPWIRVEAGGTFRVVSSGAEAEVTVSFVTDFRRA